MRDQTLREAKAGLRKWFKDKPVEYLARVADECRAGTFGLYDSCHCIRGLMQGGYEVNDDREACDAEYALHRVAFPSTDMCIDTYEYIRRNRTLPIVLAEIRRRAKHPATQPELTTVTKD